MPPYTGFPGSRPTLQQLPTSLTASHPHLGLPTSLAGHFTLKPDPGKDLLLNQVSKWLHHHNSSDEVITIVLTNYGLEWLSHDNSHGYIPLGSKYPQLHTSQSYLSLDQ